MQPLPLVLDPDTCVVTRWGWPAARGRPLTHARIKTGRQAGLTGVRARDQQVTTLHVASRSISSRPKWAGWWCVTHQPVLGDRVVISLS